MALVRCILGTFLGVACHCFPPLFRCSHFSLPGASTSATTWARMLSGNFAEMTTFTPIRDLLHNDGFTSPPKEGVLRILSPLKIRRLRPGLNPRTWVLKASTLPLDHRRYILVYLLLSIVHFYIEIPTIERKLINYTIDITFQIAKILVMLCFKYPLRRKLS